MSETVVTTTDIGSAARALRQQQPLVQCITNYVSMDLAANLLNAAGASPAMVHDVHEAGEFAGLADAVVANIGTPSPAWAEGMLAAVETAHRRGIPWVFDPVAVGATGYRRDLAGRLLEHRPTVIRGNAGEILALAGVADASRGVDSAAGTDQAAEAAQQLAGRLECVVAVTGADDLVTDGHHQVIISGGDPRAPMITALGCATTALVAGCVAASDPLTGTTTALAMITAAIERAGRDADGPGSLRWRLLDQLSTVSAQDLSTVRIR